MYMIVCGICGVSPLFYLHAHCFVDAMLQHSCLEVASCAGSLSISMMKRPASAMLNRPAAAVVSDDGQLQLPPKKRRRLHAVNTDTSIASEDYVCEMGRPKHSNTAYVQCPVCGFQAVPASVAHWFENGACPSCGNKKIDAIYD